MLIKKPLKVIALLTLIITFSYSCSKTSNTTIGKTVYYKTTVLRNGVTKTDRVIEYDKLGRVTKTVALWAGNSNLERLVTYTDNDTIPSRIVGRFTKNEVVESIVYDFTVSHTKNTIYLKNRMKNKPDWEFIYTNNYIDSFSIYEYPLKKVKSETYYRDEQNNLLKIVDTYGDETHYANYDTSHKPEPYGGAIGIIDFPQIDMGLILNLKESKHSPLTRIIDANNKLTRKLLYTNEGYVSGFTTIVDNDTLIYKHEYKKI